MLYFVKLHADSYNILLT